MTYFSVLSGNNLYDMQQFHNSRNHLLFSIPYHHLFPLSQYAANPHHTSQCFIYSLQPKKSRTRGMILCIFIYHTIFIFSVRNDTIGRHTSFLLHRNSSAIFRAIKSNSQNHMKSKTFKPCGNLEQGCREISESFG